MKTVYVLGAGFSMDAGIPAQASLISKAFDLNKTTVNRYDDRMFKKFEDFLTDQLNFSSKRFGKIQLEDIFTPLDRCLADNIQYRGIAVKDILQIREVAFYVIAKTIELTLNNTNDDKQYISHFAEYLVNKSSKRINNYQEYDPISIISTNWDDLLDNEIYEYIQKEYENKAVVDYCCYISSLKPSDNTVKSGLEVLGAGGFNVKLLKLHGSINWLQCPRCMRIYTAFKQKVSASRNEYCRHCESNFSESPKGHKLISNLIMPTFIKDLSNPQYKIIWQNAGIEISEAERLVFIGYSLPSSDFEIRQLISRMVRKNVKIDVVDFKINESEKEELRERWTSFFGDRDISFFFDGAKNYISNSLE